MKRRKKSKRRISIAAVLMIASVCLMAVSVSLRWTGIGGRLAIPSEPFQLEVLNGTGEPGVAGETTKKLRRMGIDVLLEGNAERFDFRQSLLVDRKGNPALMKMLSRRLGCEMVIEQIQERPRVDATFIIGWDRDRLRLQ
jgi:hypothetical protein